jgi:protocatechuate 3,4-dioxygenase beta subunit
MLRKPRLGLLISLLAALLAAGLAVSPTGAQSQNIALNQAGSGLPSPLESDGGWGGGNAPWDMVDGATHYGDTWAHGLAFTGGTGGWSGQPCGWRQATIVFDGPQRFDRVRVWHHGRSHVPNTYRVEFWDGGQWRDVGGSSTLRADLETTAPDWGSVPTESAFPAVLGSKVRFALNNCDIEHGWIYEFEVFAPDGATIKGRVADLGGAPVAGVVVNCGALRATTDSAGNYSFADLPALTCDLTPARPGYRFLPASRRVTVPPSASGQDFSASLIPPPSSVTGRVTNSAGAPLVEAMIRVDGRPTAATDRSGAYALRDLQPGTYTLTVAYGTLSFSPPSIVVSVPPNASNQNFQALSASLAGSIAGRVSAPNGAGLAGVTLSTSGGRLATTDANGNYELANLAPGTYTLMPTKGGYSFSPPQIVVAVSGRTTGQNFVAGELSASASIAGGVYFNSADPSNLAAGILVHACPVGGSVCAKTFTDNLGQYTFRLAVGRYALTATPGGAYLPSTIGPVELRNGQALTGQNFILRGPQGLPPGTGLVPATTRGDVAKLNSRQPLTITHQACVAATEVRYQVLVGGRIVREGLMAEQIPLGTYRASIAPLDPLNGYAQVKVSVRCRPSEPPKQTLFDVYIDPSGVVQSADGRPLTGATVTLLRSDNAEGPFEEVLDGSALMSAANRHNPDLSNESGHFGWDVVPGYYKVRAEKQGCFAASDHRQRFVESPVMAIPPPVTDLVLSLDCPIVFLPLVVR